MEPIHQLRLSVSKSEALALRQIAEAQVQQQRNTGREQHWVFQRARPSCLPSEFGGLPVTLFPTNDTVGQGCCRWTF